MVTARLIDATTLNAVEFTAVLVSPPVVCATVTDRAPCVAAAAIVTSTSIRPAVWNVVELTVMPVPEKLTVSPAWKPAPSTCTTRLVAPWVPVPGLVDVTEKLTTCPLEQVLVDIRATRSIARTQV